MLILFLSLRMYQTKFKKWGLSKNLSKSQKIKMIDQMMKTTKNGSPSSKVSFDRNTWRKLARYSKSWELGQLSKGRHPTSVQSFVDSAGTSPVAQRASCEAPTEDMQQINRHNDISDHPKTSTSVRPVWSSSLRTPNSSSSELLFSHVDVMTISEARSECHNTEAGESNSLPYPSTCFEPSNTLSLDKILWSVHTLCTNGHPADKRSSSIYDLPDWIFFNSGTKFWDELGHGIYLLKISQTARAMPALHTAGHLAIEALQEPPLKCAIQLFSVLSPVNTVVCASLRTSLLRMLYGQSKASLGPLHPLTILIRELHNDVTYHEISAWGLDCIVDLLTTTRDSSDLDTVRAQIARTKILRRSGQSKPALSRAQKLLEVSRAAHGSNALQTRKAAREVEHVLMDIGHWREALQMCMDIIGEVRVVNGVVQPLYNDRCAASTMEDIAKIYDNLSDADSSIAWLKGAAISGQGLLRASVAEEHIVDKVVTALQLRGEDEEAEVWRQLCPSIG